MRATADASATVPNGPESRPWVCGDAVALLHGCRPERHEGLLAECTAWADAARVRLQWMFLERGRLGSAPERLLELSRAGEFGKIAARDLPVALAQRRSGALTVSACLLAARRLRAVAVVTGAIGGVHPDDGGRLDVSADLIELSRAGVPVVAAGIKPIVDVGATLEVLETLGVPVVGWGTAHVPVLYANDSPFATSARCESAADAWAIAAQARALTAFAAPLFVVPVDPSVALRYALVSAWANDAIAAAHAAGVRGPAVTAAVLARMTAASEGALLAVNEAALLGNVRAAVALAAAAADVRGSSDDLVSSGPS